MTRPHATHQIDGTTAWRLDLDSMSVHDLYRGPLGTAFIATFFFTAVTSRITSRTATFARTPVYPSARLRVPSESGMTALGMQGVALGFCQVVHKGNQICWSIQKRCEARTSQVR